MTRAMVCLALLAASVTGPVAAQEVRYSANCGMEFDDGAVVLRGDILAFHESECRIANAEGVRDMPGAAVADLVCAGEGEEWTDRAFLQPSHDGGLILVRGGFALMLPRCP